jgi:hypothetical protein
MQTRVLLIGCFLKQPRELQGLMSLRRLAHLPTNRPKASCHRKRHRRHLTHRVERQPQPAMASTSKLFLRRSHPPRLVRKGELTVGLRHRVSRTNRDGWTYQPHLVPCSVIQVEGRNQVQGACWTESGDRPDGIQRIRSMTKSRRELTISLITRLKVAW